MTLNFQDTPLYQEVQAVMQSGLKPIAHTWKCTIHANGRDIPALFVEQIERDRNYLRNYSDIHSVEVTVSAGTLHYLITPFKSALSVTLQKIPLTASLTPTPDTTRPPVAFKYTAQLWENGSGLVEANTPNLLTQQTADNTQHLRCKFQLLDPVVEQVRAAVVATIFRDCTGIDVIKYLLGKYSEQAAADATVAVVGVDVAPGFSTEVRDHIVVPRATKLPQVPRMVNEQCGGLYPSGFNFYMQNNLWYIFSPFDISRYQTCQNTLTVLNIPANRMPHSEVSYRQTSTQVVIMSTGKVKHIDPSEQMQLNYGNGTRFVQASKVMNDFGVAKGNKYTVDMSKNVTALTFNPRPNGVNVITESPDQFTEGNFNQYSALQARAGSFIHVTWDNSVDDILYPGMPVKFMFLQDGQPQELYGVLVGVYSYDEASNVNPVDRRFVSKSVLTIFANAKVSLDSQSPNTPTPTLSAAQQSIGTP